jgi:hypothetical protein
MRYYVGFDDTDTKETDRGTGKLARWFAKSLPTGCTLWGVVRQQLLVDPAIPYTSHNSSACVVVDCPPSINVRLLIEMATEHLLCHFVPGSDPGLCIMPQDFPFRERMIDFGLTCTTRIVSQAEALAAASGIHISGHGGTNDGIIGAAAAVGLTACGWSGRFVEYGDLRALPPTVPVGRLREAGIGVVSLDRDAHVPPATDMVETAGWLRPRLVGGAPVLFVAPKGPKVWSALGRKRKKDEKEDSHGRKDLLP